MNSIKENQHLEERNKQIPISLYYKKTVEENNGSDVTIIDSNMIGMEKKLKSKSKSKSKTLINQEEEKRLTVLNVLVSFISNLVELPG